MYHRSPIQASYKPVVNHFFASVPEPEPVLCCNRSQLCCRIWSGSMERQALCRQNRTSSHVVQVQVSLYRTRTCVPRGAHRAGEVGPKTANVGTPTAAAKCVMPESCPMNILACASRPATDTISRLSTIRTGSAPRWRRSDARISESAGPPISVTAIWGMLAITRWMRPAQISGARHL